MANTKELKKRISLTKNILKITSAMKLISVSKLGRAQVSTQASKLYNEKLTRTLDRMTKIDSYLVNPSPCKEKKAVLIIISSDKGLCGSFNINIQKYVREFVAKKSDYKFLHYYIGRKAKEKRFHALRLFNSEMDNRSIENLLNIITALYRHGDISEAFVIHSEFESILNISPVIKRILPLDFINEEVDEVTDYLYDVNKNELGEFLITLKLFSDLKLAIVESDLCAHASRMTAMDNASRNCSEMIKELTTNMNRIRQSQITTELTEIISGAEALKE